MEEPLKVKIIVGSVRQGRFAEHPARWVYEKVAAMPDIEAEILDLKEYPMPFFSEPVPPSASDGYEHPVVQAWDAKIAEADAFVMVSPEYNHGYPAVLKNALDYTYKHWNSKPVAFVSYGSTGGARAVEQLRQVAVELQMAPIRSAVHIPAPWNLLEKDGGLKNGALEPYDKSAEGMFSQLLWWAKALKAARQQKVSADAILSPIAK